MAACCWRPLGYYLLTAALLRVEGCDSQLAHAVGRVLKERISLVLYVQALPLAFVIPALACGLYGVVAAMWLIPDRRIERALAG